MKTKSTFARILALLFVAALMVGMLAGCGDNAATDGGSNGNDANVNPDAPAAGSKGKILYLSNLSSGIQYEFYVAYLNMMAANLGYTVEVVYGDGFNDPAGNLSAIKNAFTSDVKGIIACQDGGLQSIMEEYPDVYVVGFMSDMDSVYDEDGTSHGVMEKDHWLGAMTDGYLLAQDAARVYADEVIARGYKKIATMVFPAFAYPKHTLEDATFRQYIEEYNATASEPIEIVGEAEVLNFSPLESSYFLDPAHQDLDAIVGMLAGGMFIYPTMISAKRDGTCPADLQLLTGGYDNDPDIMADCGDDKSIVILSIASVESVIWPMAMLDAAISGTMYPDYSEPLRMDSGHLNINSTEKFEAMRNNSPMGDKLDITKAQSSWDEMKDYFISVNPSATYAGLCDYCQSFTVEGYMK